MEVATPQALALCADIASSGGMGWAEWARLFLLAATAAGAWGIAAVNWRNQRTERTTEVVRMVSLDANLGERLARIFHYRRRDRGYADPYENQITNSYENDLVIALNFFESICIEVAEGLVSRKKIREHVGQMIVDTEKLLDDLAVAQRKPADEVKQDYKVLCQFILVWRNQPSPFPQERLRDIRRTLASRNRWIVD